MMRQLNFSDPFDAATMISFAFPGTDRVDLGIYGLIGREAATVITRELGGRHHQHGFNAQTLAGGVYFHRLATNTSSQTNSMILLR